MAEPGITTGALDAYAADLIKKEGGTSPFLGYRGFPGTICVSVNNEVVHGIGGPRKLLYGDIVKLDIGVVIDGWVGDNATTVAIGAIDPEIEKLLQATETALHRGIDKAFPGNRLHDIGAAIEKHVIEAGYSVVRDFVGHGVGKTLHEEPQIPNYGKPHTGPKLKPGMTFAIEPMVNMGGSGVKILSDGWTVVTMDSKPSAHFEHTVLITEDGPEILTCQKITVSN